MGRFTASSCGKQSRAGKDLELELIYTDKTILPYLQENLQWIQRDDPSSRLCVEPY